MREILACSLNSKGHTMRASALAFAALVLVSTCLSAFAESEKSTPYATLDEIFSRVTAAAKYKHVEVFAQISPHNPARKPQDLVFTIEAKSGHLKLPCDAQGRINWPSSESLRSENPPVRINVLQSEKLSMKVGVNAVVADRMRFTTDELRASLADADALIADQAGMLSWFAPKFTAFVVTCGTGCSATVGAGAAVGKTLASDATGQLTLPIQSSWARHAETITLTKPAVEITFKTD
jgi:hypothetical protein